jgi:hypothetical protein
MELPVVYNLYARKHTSWETNEFYLNECAQAKFFEFVSHWLTSFIKQAGFIKRISSIGNQELENNSIKIFD